MKKKSLLWSAILGALLGAIMLFEFPNLFTPQSSQPPSLSGNATDPSHSAQVVLPVNRQQGPVSYSSAVQKAAPAVVNVFTSRIVRQYSHPLLEDPLFQYFFGYGGSRKQERIQSSLGSGVIVDAKGYILTNNHVIEGADEIIVALRDGREFKAKIVGTDPETDLAVLHTEQPQLPSVTLGASEKLEIGDVVLAIGNPFGVGQTVTMGIVSATGRNQLGLSTYENFIQTDAAINPGNSGGALIDAYGNLIGINTAIFSKSGGSEGIGFAIPSQLAEEVMLEIIKQGYVIRGWLGIEVQPLTPELATSFGVSKQAGVIVAGIYRNGPAHRAGILPGDIITHVNGKAFISSQEVMTTIAKTKPGHTVEIDLLREGKKQQIEVETIERPSL